MEARGYGVVTVSTEKSGFDYLAIQRPSLVVVENLPQGMTCQSLIQEINSRAPATPVIVVADTVECKTLNASEPSTLHACTVYHVPTRELLITAEILLTVQAEPLPCKDNAGFCLAQSKAMSIVREMVEGVADTDATVLILGESGVGKEMVASLLLAQSLRRNKPFIKINCAALPSELLEAELFGFEKGAFTGAHRSKPGKFELAHTGTVFLDEVGELSPPLQAKLLQVLQEGEFSRLGGQQNVRVNVRIIASTNQNLEKAIESGTFRADLYYRLNVVNITVPPLRQRREEIPILINYFLKMYSDHYHRPQPMLSARTQKLLGTYHWPGNVRELENIMKRIILLKNEEFIVDALQTDQEDRPTAVIGAASCGLKELGRHAAHKVEYWAIKQALAQTQWNRTQAAKLLKISYKALLYKMQKCRLSSFQEEDDMEYDTHDS